MKPFLVVNRRSAGGRTGRDFDRIARAVRAAVGEFEWAFTGASGDGARLAQEALSAGSELVVAVGGDGTASEVVHGIASSPRARDPALVFGFIPRGTGSDLRRSLGLPTDLDAAARVLAGRRDVLCDIGRVDLSRPDGRPVVRHFANVTGFGIDGVVVREVNRGLRLGGKLSFTLAAGKALLGWSDQPVRWRADGGPWQVQRITAVTVCNGRFFGGGMMVAPDARMDDGLFDVVVWSGLGIRHFLTKRRMLYDGTHVQLPNTRVLRARVVEAEPLEGASVLLDVDGEQPGALPVRITLLPGALRVRTG